MLPIEFRLAKIEQVFKQKSETITCQSISSKYLLTEIQFWPTFQNKLNNAKNSFEHVLFSTNLAANQTVLL